jgi:Zn finger protein HypA/HybF involved in hydrogenase expression
MHEVSLVAELVEAAQRRAAGRTIASVRVRHASSIDETTLRQAYALLTQDGPLAAARLFSTTFDIDLACPCGFSGPLGHDDLIGGSIAVCPSCRAVSTVHRTAELELLAVETTT